MSVLPPIAEVLGAGGDVRKVPGRDFGPSSYRASKLEGLQRSDESNRPAWSGASVAPGLSKYRPAAHSEFYDLKELLLTHAALGLYGQTGIQGHEITSQRGRVSIRG